MSRPPGAEEPAFTISTNSETAGQRRAEDELRQQRDLDTALLRALSDLGEGLAIDADRQLLYVNDAFCRLSGYSLEELRALPSPYAIVPPEEQVLLQQRLLQRQLGGQQQDYYETAILRKDGQRVEVDIALETLPVGGRTWRILVIRDITARKRMEAALRESEAGLALAQRIAQVGNWDFNPTTRELRCSDEMRRIFGCGPSALEGAPESLWALDLVHPDDRAAVRAAFERALHQGQPYSQQYRIQRPDGTERVVFEQVEVVSTVWGRDRRVVGTVRDVTERVERERARELFIGMIAHDIRGPLTTIKGYADLIRGQLIRKGVDPELLGGLEVLSAEATRLARLTANIVDSASLRLDRISLKREPVDLVQLAIEIAGQVQATTSRHAIRVEAAEPVHGHWDGDRLRQIVHNLVANAVKYSPEGGPVAIRIGLRQEQAEISVSDRGMGIAPEAIPSLFNPFFRAASAGPRRAGSTGLGLYITRQLVQAHGGSIQVESVPGEGTTFTCTLPR